MKFHAIMKNERASSFVLSLLYVNVIFMLLLHAVTFLTTMREIAHNDEERSDVYYAAEAGLYMASEQIMKQSMLSAFHFQMNRSAVDVSVTSRQSDAVVLVSRATRAPYYATVISITFNPITGKISRWEDSKS